MAVVSANETREGRNATEKWEGAAPTRAFVVVTNAVTDGADVVIAGISSDATLSGAKSRHPDYPNCIVDSIRAVPLGDGLHWTVTVQYRTMTGPRGSYTMRRGSGLTAPEPNPLARPPEIRYSFMHGTTILEKDLNGAAVLNSANVPFDPPVEVPVAHPVLQVTTNQATYNNPLAAQYVNSVNSDTWYGTPPDQLRIHDIGAQRMHEAYAGGTWFWQMTIEIHRFQGPETAVPGTYAGWQPYLLDAGLKKISSTDPTKWEVMSDDSGKPFNEPVPLDGAGGQLAANSSNQVFIKFQGFQPRNFASYFTTLGIQSYFL